MMAPAKKPATQASIIIPEIKAIQKAFDHFNRHLFGNELPQVIITLHRARKAAG